MPEKVKEKEEAIAVPAWQGEWKIDLSDWTTMESIFEWQKLARAANFAEMSRVMTGVIRRWPYPLDPAKVESYGKLSPAQWKETAQRMGNSVGAFFRDEED